MSRRERIRQVIFYFGVAAFVSGIAGNLLTPDAQGTLRTLFTTLCGFGAGFTIVGAVTLAWMARVKRDPAAAKQLQIDENDERNIQVREKAGFMSWWISLITLGAITLVSVMLGNPLAYGLAFAALVIHRVGYFLCRRHYDKQI